MDETHRRRLLSAMSDAIAETGYDALTVAEVVQRAHTSKRTFYEHFSSKEDAFLALYEASSAHVVEAVEEALEGVPPGAARIERGVAAYLSALQARPAVLRTVIIAILRTGARGLKVRRAVNRRYAALLLREMVPAHRRSAHATAVATALVGGINELVMEAVEEGHASRLTELADSISALLRPFLQGAAPEEQKRRRR